VLRHRDVTEVIHGGRRDGADPDPVPPPGGRNAVLVAARVVFALITVAKIG
jgi:hypothetical protein